MSNQLPAEPSREMWEAFDVETPYICRRSMENGRVYEVIRMDNEDFEEVITGDQTLVFTGPEDEAQEECDWRRFQYRYKKMVESLS